MKQRFLSILLIFALSLSFLSVPVFADSGFSNFHEINTYSGQFKDVPANAWYAESVASAYRLGLVAGTSATVFNPDGNLKISEVITLACSLHSRYFGKTIPDVSAGQWYQKYVEYALANGIISNTYADYSRSATRAECITILSKSLPAEGFAEINNIESGAIPDVAITASYAEPVYKFYRAGIMQGYAGGEFRPANYIRRCEIAATLLRLADPSIRGEFTLEAKKELTAEKIAEKCANAVFYVEVYDRSGSLMKTGSGFFIDSAGTAVTNYHVIDGASSAKILLTNGKIYDVAGVYDYNAERDTALLKISGSGFEYLPLADSDAVVAGQTVFAIGSPQGLDNTISQGIISNVRRWVDDGYFIQTTAQISPGSSGGALLNAQGEAVGITTAYINLEGSQNLNLAIPINDIHVLKRGQLQTLASIAGANPGMPQSGGDYEIILDYDSVTMSVNSGIDITVYTDGPGVASVHYWTTDTSIVDCAWGEWEDDYNIPLSLYSYKKGNVTITVSLLDEYDNVLHSKSFPVTVTDRSFNNSFSVSSTKISLAPGQSTSITVSQRVSDYVSVHWQNPYESIATCEWGEWNGTTSVPLTITGVSTGNATIYIDLYGDGRYAGSVSVTVKVGDPAQNNAYTFLKNYAVKNGIYYSSDNSYFAQFGSYQNNGITDECYISYYASDNEIAIIMGVETGELSRMDMLMLPPRLSGPYTFYMQCTNDNFNYSGTANIDSSRYRYQDAISFLSFDGPSAVINQEKTICGNELSTMLLRLQLGVLGPAGYTLRDLGFSTFTN